LEYHDQEYIVEEYIADYSDSSIDTLSSNESEEG